MSISVLIKRVRGTLLAGGGGGGDFETEKGVKGGKEE